MTGLRDLGQAGGDDGQGVAAGPGKAARPDKANGSLAPDRPTGTTGAIRADGPKAVTRPVSENRPTATRPPEPSVEPGEANRLGEVKLPRDETARTPASGPVGKAVPGAAVETRSGPAPVSQPPWTGPAGNGVADPVERRASRQTAAPDPRAGDRSTDRSGANRTGPLRAAMPDRTPTAQGEGAAQGPEGFPLLRGKAGTAFTPEDPSAQPFSPLPEHRAVTASSLPQVTAHPRDIARQMAAALPPPDIDGTTELQLDPVELGSVRMTIQAIDGGVTLAVQAERPETADLMRRHLGELAQELHDLGYGEVNLSVSTGQGRSGQEPPATAKDSPAETPAPPDGPAPVALPSRPALSGSGGLDLRL